MKEISKKDLLNVILETAGEMDELAVRQKGVQAQRIDPTTGEVKVNKAVPGWYGDNETDIPDYWTINKTGIKGEEILIVPLGCEKLEDYVEAKRERLDEIAEKTGLVPMLTACGLTKWKPRNTKVGTSYVPSGNKKPAETNIKIDLHRLVFEYLGNPEMAAKLERLSMPAIEARNEKNLNRYGEINNNVVQYQTHSFNSYTSANQFLQFVTARISNKAIPEEAKSYYLARQFNQLYSNWEETKKNEKNFVGKTPAYKLDKFGFDEANLDVTVRTDLIINGRREGESFLWSVKLESKFGRKLQEQYTVSGGLKLNKEKTIVKSAQIEPNTEFTDSYTILDNLPIKTALVEALSEMQEYVLSLKPIEALKNANFKRPDITNKPIVNESEKERLQERLIKRITNS
jgi:hypothetical protein